ncbi:MAG: hypothetical protein ACE5JL_16280 [Dehalococcoidia bacterium]
MKLNSSAIGGGDPLDPQAGRAEPQGSEGKGQGSPGGTLTNRVSPETELEVDDLLTQYGQAMARIGRLEMGIQTLEQEAKSLRSQAEELARKQHSIQEIKQTLGQKQMEIIALNSRVAVLKAQLGGRETPVLPGGHWTSHHRRRRRHRRWWQFWRRRHRSRH